MDISELYHQIFIGFTGVDCSVRSHNSRPVEDNISSASANLSELGLGRIAGPFELLLLLTLNIPPLAMREESKGKF